MIIVHTVPHELTIIIIHVVAVWAQATINIDNIILSPVTAYILVTVLMSMYAVSPLSPITYLSPPRIYLHHYKGITFKTYAVRLCPLMSAYDRVLTFRRVILTKQHGVAKVAEKIVQASGMTKQNTQFLFFIPECRLSYENIYKGGGTRKKNEY